jgi:hypothetical protein
VQIMVERQALMAQGIPENEWPEHLITVETSEED